MRIKKAMYLLCYIKWMKHPHDTYLHRMWLLMSPVLQSLMLHFGFEKGQYYFMEVYIPIKCHICASKEEHYGGV